MGLKKSFTGPKAPDVPALVNTLSPKNEKNRIAIYDPLLCTKIKDRGERVKVFYENWIAVVDNLTEVEMGVKSSGSISNAQHLNKSFIILDLPRFRDLSLFDFIEHLKYDVIYMSMEKVMRMHIIFCAHIASAVRFQLLNIYLQRWNLNFSGIITVLNALRNHSNGSITETLQYKTLTRPKRFSR